MNETGNIKIINEGEIYFTLVIFTLVNGVISSSRYTYMLRDFYADSQRLKILEYVHRRR